MRIEIASKVYSEIKAPNPQSGHIAKGVLFELS